VSWLCPRCLEPVGEFFDACRACDRPRERQSRITPEEVDAALERGAKSVEELRELLRPVFSLPSRHARLRLR
jgi:hypothetical protein